MNSLRIFCTAGLVAAAATLTAPPAPAQSVDAEVEAAYAAWNAAFDAGDAKALAAFYTEDAVFMPATHDVITGPAGVEAFFAPMFEMGVTGHKLEMIEASGDGALIAAGAKWSATGKGPDGADQPWAGLATHVFERQDDGSLKLKLHSFN